MVTNVYPSTVKNPSLLTNFANVKSTEGAAIDTTWHYDTPANTSLKWVNPGSVIGEGIKINAQTVIASTTYTLDLIFNGSVSGKNMIANIYQSNGTTLITSKTFTTTGQPQIIPVPISNPSGNTSIIVTIVTNTTAQALTCHIDSVWLYTGSQATYQSAQSGDFETTSTWNIRTPCDAMAFTINSSHSVRIATNNQYNYPNGLGAFINNGILHFKQSVLTELKVNGNITGTGALYVCERVVTSGFTLVIGKTYTYQVSTPNLVDSVEETLGNGYTQVSSIALVESTPSSFYYDGTANLYIHCSDSANPNTHTITIINPIQRPTAGGNGSQCTLMFTASPTAILPTLQFFGWYPPIESSALAVAASLNATQIVLSDDMGLQAGDQIIIGSGTENYVTLEEEYGLYTVSSYNSSTKTITLTSGLGTARLLGDNVGLHSRPWLLSRNSGYTVPIFGTGASTPANHVNIIGGLIMNPFNQNWNYNPVSNWNIAHCTFDAYYGTFVSIKGGNINNCIYYDSESFLDECLNVNIDNVLAIMNENFGSSNYRCTLQNSIVQNCWALSSFDLIQNVKCQNFANLIEYESDQTVPLIKNCNFLGGDVTGLPKCGLAKYVSCTFYDNTNNYNAVPSYGMQFNNNGPGYFANSQAKLYNTLFSNPNVTVGNITSESSRNPWEIVESFDHNQIVGNYAAWMLGGTITTSLSGSTPQINKLIFNPTSATAPVFRDFKFTVPANKLMKPFSVPVTLSALGMTMQLQIIDPANDPLIDSSATPLVTVNAANVTTAQNLSINYKSTVAKELILRILVQAASGTVNVDVTQIMQSMAKPPMIVKR